MLVVELPVSVAISGSTGTSIDKMTETMKPAVAMIASAAISLRGQPSASSRPGGPRPDVRSGRSRGRFVDHYCLPAGAALCLNVTRDDTHDTTRQ